MKFQKSRQEQIEEKYLSMVPKILIPITREHKEHGMLVHICSVHDREQLFFFGELFSYYIQ